MSLEGTGSERTIEWEGKQQVSTLGPNEFRDLFKQATKLKSQGDLAVSTEKLRLILAHEPKACRSLHLLGVIEWEQGGDGRTAAIQLFREAVDAKADIPAFHRSLGLSLLETVDGTDDSAKARKEEALEHLQKAAKLMPSNCELQMNLARAQKATQRFTEAASTYTKCLELEPANASAWYKLGHIQIRLNKRQGEGQESNNQKYTAAECFAKAVEFDSSHESARYWLSVVSADGTPASAPASYVAKLFDGYAQTFDEHLVGKLKYQTPTLLRTLVDGAMAQAKSGKGEGKGKGKEATTDDSAMAEVEAEIVSGGGGEGAEQSTDAQTAAAGTREHFCRCADLGCGTGLAGVAFVDLLHPDSHQLVGVDLSAKMVDQARARGIYTQLVVGDLIPFLNGDGDGDGDGDGGGGGDGGGATSTSSGRTSKATYDLVLAADTLPYIGTLDPLMQALQGCCEPGALVAYSVELAADADNNRASSSSEPPAPPTSASAASTAAGSGGSAPNAAAASTGGALFASIAGIIGNGCGYQLQLTGRYAHSRWYLRTMAEQHGFVVLAEHEADLRYNQGEAIKGLLVLLQKKQ